MRSAVSKLVGSLALTVLGACAFIDHKATLNPTVAVASSGVGTGRSVQVAVVDERPRSLIGRRGAGGQIGGTITTDQAVDEVVRAKLVEGLQRDGFTIATGGGSDTRTMKVEIR